MGWGRAACLLTRVWFEDSISFITKSFILAILSFRGKWQNLCPNQLSWQQTSLIWRMEREEAFLWFMGSVPPTHAKNHTPQTMAHVQFFLSCVLLESRPTCTVHVSQQLLTPFPKQLGCIKEILQQALHRKNTSKILCMLELRTCKATFQCCQLLTVSSYNEMHWKKKVINTLELISMYSRTEHRWYCFLMK